MSENHNLYSSLQIYDDLRGKLITACFKPGEKLKSEVLRQEYDCAASTMREVLFRLSCKGFVDFQEQRGFRVPFTSREALHDLTQMRIILETQGVKMSMDHPTIEWHAKLNAAHHKLAHIESTMWKTGDVQPYVYIWNDAEWEFHETLIMFCGSQILRATHKNIYARFRQHLVSGLNHFGFREKNVREHAAILEAVLAGDAELCAKRIHDHLMINMDNEKFYGTATSATKINKKGPHNT